MCYSIVDVYLWLADSICVGSHDLRHICELRDIYFSCDVSANVYDRRRVAQCVWQIHSHDIWKIHSSWEILCIYVCAYQIEWPVFVDTRTSTSIHDSNSTRGATHESQTTHNVLNSTIGKRHRATATYLNSLHTQHSTYINFNTHLQLIKSIILSSWNSHVCKYKTRCFVCIFIWHTAHTHTLTTRVLCKEEAIRRDVLCCALYIRELNMFVDIVC